MRIVKPYGRTETAPDEEGRPKRRIRPHPGDGDPRDVETFAANHPEAVVAQWVSTVDRIAAKPPAGKKPTREQRDLRDRLGTAAWEVLKDRLPPARLDELKGVWRRKIHPYGEGVDEERRGQAKGRWYVRFAGKGDPRDADAAGVARKIGEHLHEREYRIDAGRPDKRRGRIAAGAAGVAAAVAPLDPPDAGRGWSGADRKAYAAAGNVAAAIVAAAKDRENGKRRVGPDVAAKELHGHYAKLFVGADGEPLPVAGARRRKPGLFALHGAVRDAYSRILKNHRKDLEEHGERRRRVSMLLPADMDALFRLVAAKGRNRDLAALIRLGKAIHYEAPPPPDDDAPAGDEPINVVARWPAAGEIERGRYRTSAGQTEIKRNEAFVRVWRVVAALAQRTLTDWADPERKIDRDILAERNAAIGDGFDRDAYRGRLPILFGDRARLFEAADDEAFERSVLGFALKGWEELRNGSFHFKGRGGFVRALKRGAEGAGADSRVLEAVRALLERDAGERRARLIDTLRAAHVGDYLEKDRVRAVLAAVDEGARASSPMPRFRRVLVRAENAWRRDKRYRLRLPGPENRRTLEAKPGLRCRYVVLKTLYERAFPTWLEARNGETLNRWIGRAEERATEAARDINKDPDAASRAAGLVRLKDGEGVAAFADRLAALTATEYRVQRGYASDADKAREQAGHIENLRCDVVAQAFAAYLEVNGLSWARDDFGAVSPKDGKTNPDDFDAPPKTWAEEAEDWAEDWRAALYFLLHMVPVEAAGRLRHQLRKWAVLEGKARDGAPSTEGAAVEELLDLYLDMHDAKFEGGEGVAGAEALKGLFRPETLFRRVCPERPGADDHVPRRGLREMLRFGADEPRLMPVFREHPVVVDEADELDDLERPRGDGGASLVAEAQAERERLHATWVERKKGFSGEDKAAYRAALDTVVRHRRLAAHVRLVDHARLHRLAMDVLGRLADYAGLWERDLYFATLALIHREGKTPQEVFKDEGDLLSEGRIVDALRKIRGVEESSGPAVLDGLKKLFGADFLDKDGAAGIRNDLLHFNMLQRKADEPLDLTRAVDDTRRLTAYDRKLKNAVTKSIAELLAREGLDVTWEMDGGHRLGNARLTSRRAVHLGGATVDGEKIVEDLHGEAFVAMAAELFGGRALPSGTRSPGRGGRPSPATRKRAEPRVAPPRPSSALPDPGGRVKATLVEEKTKKGGWKAAVDTGGRRIVGDVFNWREVPADAQPGLEKELVVRVANPDNASFEWPSPDVEARLARPKAPRRGGRPGARRR